MKPSLKLTTFFIIILLAISACSPSSSTPEINPTQGAQMLAGEYTTTITADDVKKLDSLNPDIASNQGDWSLSLTNDGKFSANKDGEFIADGNYTVENNRIEVYIQSVCQNCGCENGIGRFIWRLKDNQLSFAKTAGICDGMDLLLTAHSLTRQP